jgi:hypothetical protein
MSFRKEKKYRLSYSDMYEMKKRLHSEGMKILHPSRVISSCYYDTNNQRMYSESEEGILPRKKIRVRWYGKQKNFTKEIKISSIEGRFKYSSPVNSLTDVDDLCALQFFEQDYGLLVPTLIVSYEREYYLFHNMRITFDHNIKYTNLRFLSNPKFRDSECVMEAKVPVNCGEDYIESFIEQPTSRFSKYSRGMLYGDKMI